MFELFDSRRIGKETIAGRVSERAMRSKRVRARERGHERKERKIIIVDEIISIANDFFVVAFREPF